MKRIKGFTLTEVIITMVLVIILSLISLPIYRGRFSNQAKLAEGYALLGAIRDAQISYYNEYGNFLSAKNSFGKNAGDAVQGCYTCYEPVLKINATNNRYFSSFNYDYSNVGANDFREKLCIRVLSEKAGIITQNFRLYERYEPVASGVDTSLSL